MLMRNKTPSNSVNLAFMSNSPEANQEVVEAIRAMDLDGVMSIYASDIVSFDIVSPLQHVGAETKRKNWVDAFAQYQRPLGYEIRDLTITLGDDVAFGHSLNRISGALKNGDRTDFWLRSTICFRKFDGNWLIAHDQVSVSLDLESGRAGLLGAQPFKILQHIAGGILGTRSSDMGRTSALIGLACHFAIALTAAGFYYLASRKLRLLLEHPLICGLLYGELVFLFMYFVVLPLSALGPAEFNIATYITGPIGHPLLVGLPIARCVRRFVPQS